MSGNRELKLLEDYQKKILTITSTNLDISRRTIKAKEGEITALYIKQLTDRSMLSEYVLKPLVRHLSDSRHLPSAETVMDCIIEADDCRMEQNQEGFVKDIMSGFVVILLSNESGYLVLNLKSVEKKPVEGPELTFGLRSPSDCLNENLDTNLSLIRYRVKDPAMKVMTLEVGRRTRTRVGVLYIDNIANSDMVNDVLNRIKAIDVDGIIESGELQKMMLNNELNIFPQMGIVERSDMACGALLEGKIIILVEGSRLGLVAPKVFLEFLETCEDNYDNKIVMLFSKVLRVFCIIAAVTLSSLFIAVASFNFDVLPTDYVLALALSRTKVPFNAMTGALLLETITEILRETMLRVPKQIGPAIGIVGATIIGQAAIAAGIFSPLLLILVSTEFLASFVAPDYTIMNPLRLMKLIIIFITGTFGFIGFALGLCVLTTTLISNNSFGVPFLTPVAPFSWYDFSRTFLYSKRLAPKRPGFLKTKNKKRI